MSRNRNLDAHAERQALHPHGRQQRLMVRTVFPKVADEMPFHVERHHVAADLVDLLPALATGLLQGMLHVGKSLVDLLAQVARNLLGGAVPSACFCSPPPILVSALIPIHDDRDPVVCKPPLELRSEEWIDRLGNLKDVPWPEISIVSPIRTAWL